MKTTKIALIAPTGYGKSTAAKMIAEICPGTVNIKLAAPLYEMQNYIYKKINIEIGDTQDGELLQFLGQKIQREAPQFLATEFERELSIVEGRVPIITNDDCRSHNYLTLQRLEFQFVRVLGIERKRVDRRAVDPDHPVEAGLDTLPCDHRLDNQGSLEQCRINVLDLLERIGAITTKTLPKSLR